MNPSASTDRPGGAFQLKGSMMTDQTEHISHQAHEEIARDAYQAGISAVQRIARETGTETMSRPVRPGEAAVLHYAEPGAGLRIAHALETAAVRVTRDYIRYAREAGQAWHEIGAALDLGPVAAAREIPLAYAAFEYATGPGAFGAESWRFDYVTFPWTCPACAQTINDRGPVRGHPEDDEPGHAKGCSRLAATVAAWDAQLAEEG